MRALILQAIDDRKFGLWVTTVALKYVAVILAVVAWSIVMFRAGGVRAERRYEEWQERFANEYISQREAAEIGMPPDPKELLLDQQATALAKVLYGVKDNSDNDLRTLCWCVFNRVDNDAYPANIEEVIEQPKQWMAYYDDNPVLDNLYKLAREQILSWQNDRRPVSNEFIYMSWTPARIVLRDTWGYGMNTRTWTWGETR